MNRLWPPSRVALIRSTIVAAVFTGMVASLLVVDLARNSRFQMADIPELQQLHQRLHDGSRGPQALEAYRELDADVRRQFFTHQEFLRRGAYLLFGGMAVTFALWRWSQQRTVPVVDPRLMQRPRMREEVAVWRAQQTMVLLTVATLVTLVAVSVAAKNDPLWKAPTTARLHESPGGSAAEATSTDRVETHIADAHEVNGAAPAARQPSSVDQRQWLAEWSRQWPRFRGPDGSGHSATQEPFPIWDVASGNNVAWSVPVPLPGHGSAIVWNDNVLLAGGNEDELAVFCFRANDGSLRWRYDVAQDVASGEASSETEISDDVGYAASTPVTDGAAVYAIFPSGQLVAIEIATGQLRWSKHLGPIDNVFGHASSLAMYPGHVVVQVDQGDSNDKDGTPKSKLVSLSADNGNVVWEVMRDVPCSWTTPIVVRQANAGQNVEENATAEGNEQGDGSGEDVMQLCVITAGDPWIIAYAIEDGRELWRCDALGQDVGPSPVYANGYVVAACESPGVVVVRGGGSGDVSDSHCVWTDATAAPDTCSPLVVHDLVLVMSSFGTLACYDLATGGDPLWQEDFDDQFTASPIASVDQVLLVGHTGQCWVIKPTRDGCETTAELLVGETCAATPAVVGKRLIVRGESHLFCFETKESP
ncbi:MAG: PQQ-binding-like beta-propeller repeat protein [Pirellulaceae bacterium]|nr:PQQ-binding-like beta-propeller repeat protein [Planctomycetales bacterium]